MYIFTCFIIFIFWKNSYWKCKGDLAFYGMQYTGWSKSLGVTDDCTVIVRNTETFWSPCTYCCVQSEDGSEKKPKRAAESC